MSGPSIIFPTKYNPENSPVFVHNEIKILASPESVWNHLISAYTWNSYYKNAKKVRFLNNDSQYLSADTIFKWTTFDMPLKSQVREFVPYHRLAWEALGFGIQAYHAWLILPTEYGCKVITEETQHGFACKIGAIIFPNRMYKYHQLWLEGLKRVSEEGS